MQYMHTMVGFVRVPRPRVGKATRVPRLRPVTTKLVALFIGGMGAVFLAASVTGYPLIFADLPLLLYRLMNLGLGFGFLRVAYYVWRGSPPARMIGATVQSAVQGGLFLVLGLEVMTLGLDLWLGVFYEAFFFGLAASEIPLIVSLRRGLKSRMVPPSTVGHDL